jgi:glycosyltransferase involved in cell wall biosynthesis
MAHAAAGGPAEKQPLVSVIVPVYNGERYLAEALASVAAQDYRPIETIVVDDGSTDRSQEIAKTHPASVRYHFQPHRGIGAARNTGIGRAAGRFVAFVDADDVWTADKLRRQMQAFERDPTLDIVFGHVEQFISPDAPEPFKARVRYASQPLPGRVPGTMLARREAFSRVGAFSEPIGEVVDWMLRAQECGLKSTVLPEVLLRRRLHTANSARLRPEILGEYAKYLKASLERRRAAGRTGG